MSDFKFIKQLNTTDPITESKKPQIEYQQYDFEDIADMSSVLIPIKECKNFEQSLEQITENLTPIIIRDLLRKHRGIKNKV